MLAIPRSPLHSDSESSTTASSSLPSRMPPSVGHTPGGLGGSKSSASKQQLVQNGKDSVQVTLRPSDDVEPIMCASEKELAREFDAIHKTLSDVRGDWNNRCIALKRTQGLVLGSAHIDRFLPLCLRLREPILTQVQDLRSAVVREACTVLLVLVLALGADLEAFAVPAIPVLLRITSIAIQIVAESGFQCICAIVRECRTQRVLQALLEQFNAKNGTQRWRSTQALLLALQTHPSTVVERHVESVESVIKHCLEDTRGDVRACGKKCFWAFKSLFEERGCRFMARLDPTRQRALQADKPQPSDPREEDAEAAEASHAESDGLKEYAKARVGESPVARRPNPAWCRSNSRSNLEPFQGPPGSPERMQIVLGQGDSRRNSFGSTCTPGASLSLAAAPSPGASFTLAAAPDPPEGLVTSNQGGQLKTIAKKNSAFRPSPRVAARVTPMHGTRSPSPKSSVNSISTVPQPQRARSQANSPAPRSPSVKARELNGAGQVSCCSIPALCKMATTSEGMEQRWAALAELAERLQQRSSEEGCTEEPFPATLVEDLVGASLHGLRDAPQVAMASLAVLGALLPGQPRLCSKFLDRLLLELLALGSSGTAADLSQRFCLDMLVWYQPPEVLIETLGCLLARDWCMGNASDDGVIGCAEIGKLAALEFLETRVAASTDVCNYLAGRTTGSPAGIAKREAAAPMKILLQDLLRCCGAWPSDSGQEDQNRKLQQATARALTALQAAEPNAFKAATEELHSGANDSLFAVMSESLTMTAQTETKDDSGPRAGQQPILGTGAAARPEALEDAAPPPLATLRVPPMPRPQSKQTATPSLASILKDGSPSTLRATLRNLALAARTQDQKSWDSHFGRVLVLVLEYLCYQPADQERQGIREAALLCLQEVIVHHPRRFNDFAEIVASKLFEAYRSCGQGDRQTAQAVDRALERLMNVLEPLRALEILIPVVASDGVPLLQAATRLLSGVLQRMLPTEVMQHLGILLPGIVVAFGSQIPEHRKAAVFCLVDMYMLVGEQLMPYLAKDLTPSQLKLVTIYIGRQQKEQQELASAPVGHTGQEVSRLSVSKSSRSLLGR
eukprot:TRINITY_DN87967_c0_g1_i1.p1 TRINITY_DN87967_c0_g1~~TRINITY_DN87967_c0_g1_i1.p1  ORF type:complete len:1089 (-),score=192.08 TRINITY_DN87967_c0_g1_i1:62-3301(-)